MWQLEKDAGGLGNVKRTRREGRRRKETSKTHCRGSRLAGNEGKKEIAKGVGE